MFLLNGEHRQVVDVTDRGFQYGDGLFETMAVAGGKPLFLARHIERLARGCSRLAIPMPDRETLVLEARQLASSADAAVLKLIVTRGSGGRGYRQPEAIQPTRLFSLHPFPSYPPQFQTDGIAARFCRQRLAINPALAGIKHLNRLEQVLARAEWQEEVQEGLMLDYQGHVVEGTMSNLFFCKDGVLFSPPLGQCGIAGIVREIVIEFAVRLGIEYQEKPIFESGLLEADEIFVTNSVIGIWPVRRLEQQCFKVGRITRRMQQGYAEARKEEMSL